MKNLFILIITAGLCSAFYLLGRSQAETKYVTKEIEVIKYVQKRRQIIHSRPHAGRDDLLKLMYQNKL